MELQFDLLFHYLGMKKNLDEEQRKSALSRIQSQALEIVLDKRRRHIDQLGALSSKICNAIKKEREEKRKLQLQYCPDQLDYEEEYITDGDESDDRDRKERAKLFEDDEDGGVKLYVQNTEYKQVVLNVKDLTDICDVTTDTEAENELTSLDTEETKKKKNKAKKHTKLPSKPDPPAPSPPQAQPNKGKKKKKKKTKHNDSLSDDDAPPAASAAPQQQRITLTLADIDTLTEDFDATHARKLRQALEDLMRAQGVLQESSAVREPLSAAGPGDPCGAAVGDSAGVAISNPTATSQQLPSDVGANLDESRPVESASETGDKPTSAVTELNARPTKKKKTKRKKQSETSFDVNDVD